MKSIYIIGGLLIFILISYLILKKDLDENRRLTKNGYIKFGLLLVIESIIIIILMTMIDIYM